ncbi:MAG: hypothetical protein P4M15_13970 [Alphaproteobacteria bacterium]|nr:hypothetical protein [Alphaproteobacteria bacterium]
MAYTDIEKLTADQILAIDEKKPELLFAADTAEVTRAYHALAKKWFPDLNPDPKASDVFRHIKTLRDKAEEKLAAHTWQEAGYASLRLKTGKTLRIRSDASFDFELGTLHVSPTTLTYVVGTPYADLFKNAVTRIGALAFTGDDGKPDAKMKETYAPSLPVDFKSYEGENAFILAVRKRPDDIRLRDLLPRLPDDTRAKHAAWITSRLLEMTRYLDHAGIAHNAITPDTVFVSPSTHTIGLFGGWWYAAPYGTPLTAVLAETAEFLPDDGQPVLASGKPDREMARASAREMLGDRVGTRLTALKPAPQPMIDYLRQPANGEAQKDLQDWYQTVLPKSFGARRFTELKVAYSDVYKPGG